MSTIQTLRFQWDGESMVPVHAKIADRNYVIGEIYNLAHEEERSAKSHRQYFAAIKEAHDNLPEHLVDRLPTPEHLRKYALIKAGYRDERSITCASKAEALRVAAFIRPIDDFAVVVTAGSVVSVYTAKSQSVRAMTKKIFQQSKDDVLRVISEIIGVDPTTLHENTARAA